ncbi:MAG: AraC family transcriptional regulator [Chloroflexota bacterium]
MAADLARVAQAIEFIEAHLQSPITVADMAAAVAYSLYYFGRMFSQATHHPPYDYLMRRRLSEAAQALLQTDRRIIDIALDYQFNNPETFSRAFKRMFDLQPSQLRRQGHIGQQRLMPRLTPAHLRHLHTGLHPRPVLEERQAFQVVGVMARMSEDRATVAELWALLIRELHTLKDNVLPTDLCGIVLFPQDWEQHGPLYMAGIQSHRQDCPSPILVVKTIPVLKYARFVHRGPVQELSLTLDYVFHTWLPRSGHCLSHPLILEQSAPDGIASNATERQVLVPVQALPRAPNQWQG